MKPYRNLWQELCSNENLQLAFRKARKHKTLKPYVIEFEKTLEENIALLRTELLLHSYRPKPLETFILRDPKTRKISKSDFRDRVVHHAICNIIEPIFEKTFIHDSYANRIGKGTLKAIERFDHFQRKISKNNTTKCFALKADIKHYFERVDHNILIKIIEKRIKDKKVIWLIKQILKNHQTKEQNKGMPLGNLTSQFFANVYLNELDYFVKYILKIKQYIRYVDDFVILHQSRIKLEQHKNEIACFLKNNLKLELHPDKSQIINPQEGLAFLGLRIFPNHKLLKKNNLRKFNKKLEMLCSQYYANAVDYDKIYDFLEGWMAYAKHANTHKLRENILASVEPKFIREISTKEINKGLKLCRT